MKVKWISVLLSILCTTLHAQQVDQLFYYLSVTSTNCEVKCLVNGFPVYDISDEGPVSNQTPINLALIGEGNELKIVVKPLDDMGSVSGGIAPYAGNEVVSSDDDKEGILKFDFEVAEESTQTFSFDNERFHYGTTLTDPPVLADEEELKEFGVKIIFLFKEKKENELVQIMGPKIEDSAFSYSMPGEMLTDRIHAILREDIFQWDFNALSKEEIIPVAYCNGRVWELIRADGKPLIYYAPSPDESSFIKIYVAKIDGELKIVR